MKQHPRAAGTGASTDAWWRGAGLLLALGCAAAAYLKWAGSLAAREVLFLLLLALILYELMRLWRGGHRY